MSNFGAKTHNNWIKKDLDKAIRQWGTWSNTLSLDAVSPFEGEYRGVRPKIWRKLHKSRISSFSNMQSAQFFS